jgi:hypothetical protein
MDVAVTHKRGQWLRSIAAPSILGDGLLERARATSLGLLGFTAAVGLTIVALAFNQGWPLVKGGPVPPLPVQHQSLGQAKAASEARGRDPVTAVDRSVGKSPTEAPPSDEDDSAPSESTPSPAPSGLVVAPSAPAPSEDGDVPRGNSKSGSAPAKPAPVSPPVAPAPAAEPAPSPPAPEPEPPATVPEAPPTSSVPPWSNGNGHAYGRSGEPPGHGHDK